MFNWLVSKPIKRPADPLKENYNVYNVTFSEWEKLDIMRHQERVYLCLNENVKKERKIYNIIYKKDRWSIFTLHRSTSLDAAESFFNLMEPILNSVASGIPSNFTKCSHVLYQISKVMHEHPKWTCAHVAVKIGLEDLLNKIHNHIVANINKQEEPDLLTPLHLAIQSFNFSIFKLVYALNPDITLVDSKGNSVLHFAAMSDVEILAMMLQNPNIHQLFQNKNNDGCTALHLACYSGNPSNVREFLKVGLTVDMLTIAPPGIEIVVKKDNDEKGSKEPDGEGAKLNFGHDIIDDLDPDEIKFGGTPLHWVMHRTSLEKLIQFKFRIDAINFNGETALHVMARRLRLKCMIVLLCYGASVGDRTHENGDTPLHYAVQKADVSSTQALIVFDAKIDAVNYNKETPRHVAAKGKTEDHQLVLHVLHSVGAKRCDPDMTGCEDGCRNDGTVNGLAVPHWPSFTDETLYNKVLLEEVVQRALIKRQQELSQHEKNLRRARMICFDGGGVRGLITIQMLIEMEKYLNRPIIEYFKWVSGTSTGSIIAVLLTIGKSLRDVRNIYFRFKDKIMVGSRPYSTYKLETLLKDEIGENLMMCDLLTNHDKKVILTGTLIDRIPSELHLFRSYKSPDEICGLIKHRNDLSSLPNCEEQSAWMACRASCSAPTFFHRYGPFVDGGIIANNPTLDSLTEFQHYNSSLRAAAKNDETEELLLVLSFGTGKKPTFPGEVFDLGNLWSINFKEAFRRALYVKSIGELIISQLTNPDNHVVDRAMSWCSSIHIPYFRINPPLSEVLAIDETRDEVIINALWETKAYMHSMRDQLDFIGKLLSRKSYQTQSNQHQF